LSKPVEKITGYRRLKAPQVMIKLSSNPVYQGSASEMILIQFSDPQSVMNLMKRITGYRGLRKRK